MNKSKNQKMSEEERIKQRNLSWRERRRIISRVLFIVLSILAALIVAFALWVHAVE
jgi:hypothetical protein